MTAPSPAISVSDLSKSYGSTTAVGGVDLAVDRGVVYGFLGPNGAGKTTTMRMLTGLVEPSSGEARVGGVDCRDRAKLVSHIGLLPEEPPLYDELSGREQLAFAADVRSLSWDAVSERALPLVDRLGLSSDLDKRVDGYSKGMRQKLAFVQAVQHDPDVAFLDEPTSGLDPRAAKTLRELIIELRAEGTTVFLSTHILPVVEEIADVVGVLHDGRLVAEGPPSELIAQREDEAGDGDLEDAFLELTSEQPEPQR
ncbi:ABC transporter ATP-binding protein [Haloarcula amylovorans]|uniref:ABC transporter ATP-binding protein n=1 Tax=Haloarcula amylovorans TaxID=2562280 RepID=UPI001076499A|nr:ABC transporter ATP-binding protein [Halomicroarcula amylolytica]